MKLRGKHTILALVMLFFGFMLAFSYQHTKALLNEDQIDSADWEKEFYYRQQLIQFEENNNQLQHEIDQARFDILQLENELSDQTEVLGNLVLEKKDLQALVGELPVEGPGIFVSLKDSAFIPTEENVNQYIVHDRHIHMLINELYSAGAEAIAINGQRIFHDSHIVCIGPVIAIDGNQYPAPFVIEAIGNQETLQESLELSGGVIDILVNDQIEIEIGKKSNIQMNARMG
ncbi:Uncharacterized conserved protein YlxW, UPF0749 family [Amphibacillus marinus]|uniref:Uncharacterized conserved protein YlxW, UPF0749 family n=1 Tax=Amphibacillus marinus TaxID=872970 RepID=A0A1H8I3S8_9BACI|nr:DUF881 domain-containing protein [Amphibacillus marinus]SEN63139.1 Uncharacterized conserved protein YlxW, UPF0749 family [Amphibacillus marinus]